MVLRHFWDGMHSLSAFTARNLAAALALDRSGRSLGTGRLLDVGGGGGAYAIELCRRFPALDVTIFDLPFVCDLTRPRIAEAGLTDRIAFRGGDFFTDELPRGHDTALLSNVLHDWGENEVQTIIDRCAAHLPSGGTLLICESFVDDDKRGPVQAALMSLNMLVETWGRNYTAAEYAHWLRAAGLEPEGVTPFPGLGANGVLTARKHK